jgi:hypothetical protein
VQKAQHRGVEQQRVRAVENAATFEGIHHHEVETLLAHRAEDLRLRQVGANAGSEAFRMNEGVLQPVAPGVEDLHIEPQLLQQEDGGEIDLVVPVVTLDHGATFALGVRRGDWKFVLKSGVQGCLCNHKAHAKAPRNP